MGVRPQVLDPVELALFGGHHVDEYAGKIDNHPATFSRAFASGCTHLIVVFEVLLHCLCGRPQVADVIHGRDNEEIGNCRKLLNVQHNYVGCQLLGRNICDPASEFCCVYFDLLSRQVTPRPHLNRFAILSNAVGLAGFEPATLRL